jgi:hypothetical protein
MNGDVPRSAPATEPIAAEVDAVGRARGLIAAAETKHPLEQVPHEGDGR